MKKSVPPISSLARSRRNQAPSPFRIPGDDLWQWAAQNEEAWRTHTLKRAAQTAASSGRGTLARLRLLFRKLLKKPGAA